MAKKREIRNSTDQKKAFTIQKKESTIQNGADYSEGMVLNFSMSIQKLQ